MNPIDLNIEEQTLAEPFRCEIEPKLSGCFSSGIVKSKIELDRGGKRNLLNLYHDIFKPINFFI